MSKRLDLLHSFYLFSGHLIRNARLISRCNLLVSEPRLTFPLSPPLPFPIEFSSKLGLKVFQTQSKESCLYLRSHYRMNTCSDPF